MGRDDGVRTTTPVRAIGYGTSAVEVSESLAGLLPNTLYHYRLVAQNGETTAYGADAIFTTLEADGPFDGTMTTIPDSPHDFGAPFTVEFANWTDASLPLSYSVFIDNMLVSPQEASASRVVAAPSTPGVHTLKGRIYDALGNFTETTQNFTVLTEQESWRRFYFGTWLDEGNAADTADPDGDGSDNRFEFVAGLLPNDPASRFQLRVERVLGEPGQKAIVFSPRLADRSYVIQYKTTLGAPVWMPLTNVSTSDDGDERTAIDLEAGDAVRFYQVQITRP